MAARRGQGVTCYATYRGDKAARQLGFMACTGLTAGMERVEDRLREIGELRQGD